MVELADIPEQEEGAPASDGWQTDRAGRQYVPAQGRRGRINRQGDESVQEALERDSRPRDRKPRRSNAPKKPPPPKSVNLRELEPVLAEALASPAMICAGFGDVWAADHFTKQGPYLARNLILAAQHNPWLRKKLENAATGEDAMMKLVSMLGVGGALFAYAIPPVIYWFNLPAPEQARQMFGIPSRREPENARRPTPPNPSPPPPGQAAPAQSANGPGQSFPGSL